MRYAIPLVVCASLLTSPSAATAQTYRVVPLRVSAPGDIANWQDVTNDLTAIGFLLRAGFRIPAMWDANGNIREFQIGGIVYGSLRINNRRTIAGARVSRMSYGIESYHVFRLENGTDFRIISEHDTIFAPDVARITDTGLVLVRSNYDGSYVASGSQVRWISSPGTIAGISDDGVIGGWRGSSAGPQPYRRWPDGRESVPWPEPARLTVMGAAGHFHGQFIDPTDRNCVALFGDPDGTITRTRLPGECIVRGVNRWGDRVIRNGSRALLYRDGSFHDLNELLQTPGIVITDAWRVTDDGAVVASTRSTADGTTGEAFLIPLTPSPPRRIAATTDGRRVTLTWESSVTATDYVLEAGSAPGLSDLYRVSVGRRLQLTVAAPSGRYYVRIRARNGVGTSAASAEVIVDVP
jgi:hypothetical protein